MFKCLNVLTYFIWNFQHFVLKNISNNIIIIFFFYVKIHNFFKILNGENIYIKSYNLHF